MLASGTSADISPWIAADLYDPGKWDTAGPQTASPWLHPPTWTPGQEWGVLSGRIKDVTAITGSWGGARDELVKKGVAFAGGYLGQPAANPVGGERQDANWLQHMGFGAFLDLQRLMDWKGGFFTTSVDWKFGTELGLSPDYIGNEFPVQLATGENAFRLVHMALAQELFNNSAELAGGRIITGQDFANIRLACTSLNQAICANPIAANQSISFPTYPSAVWGARLKVKPGSSWYGQTGEGLLELNYRARITPWLFVQPDAQYIIKPRGRSDIDNAFVIGFALGSVF